MSAEKHTYLSFEDTVSALAYHCSHVAYMTPEDPEKTPRTQSIRIREARIWSFLEGLTIGGAFPEGKGAYYLMSCTINHSGVLRRKAADLTTEDAKKIIRSAFLKEWGIMVNCFGMSEEEFIRINHLED